MHVLPLYISASGLLPFAGDNANGEYREERGRDRERALPAPTAERTAIPVPPETYRFFLMGRDVPPYGTQFFIRVLIWKETL